jgi:hypothetical protein
VLLLVFGRWQDLDQLRALVEQLLELLDLNACRHGCSSV